MNNPSLDKRVVSLSQQFLQKIKDLFPNIKLAEELMRLLHIEKSGAYRRTSGTSPLSLEEMTILAGHFQISIDQFIFADANNTVSYPLSPICKVRGAVSQDS